MAERRRSWMIALLGFLVASVSLAHPFDADYYSSRAEVKAGPDGVSVVVIVEVPTQFVLAEFLELYGDPTQLDVSIDEIYRQRQFERMADELRLRLGGRKLPGTWRPVESEANGRGTETFFVYLLEFVPDDAGKLRGERLDLRIDMEVFPREFIYLSATIEVEEPWRVVKNSAESILAASSDELFDPETGRWTVDPRLRRLRLTLERGE